MVTIGKKKIGKNTYFVLEHSIREGSRIIKKEKYLGKEVPSNINELKAQFFNEIYRERWIKELEIIKSKYADEQEKTPASAKEKEMESFAVNFTYNTQRIEGSTLTLKETANLLEEGITPNDKPLNDVKEAEAHKKVFLEMMSLEKEVDLSAVLHWHKTLFEQTKPDIAGKIRKHGVAIARSRFKPPYPVELEILLHDFFRWYQKNKKKIHPVELAALVHLKFVTIHPFSDGNGRISRLMMNYVLHRFNYPLLDIPYINRTSYYNALERSQVKGNDIIFIQWFIKRYVKTHA
jgi:Fic family protein